MVKSNLNVRDGMMADILKYKYSHNKLCNGINVLNSCNILKTNPYLDLYILVYNSNNSERLKLTNFKSIWYKLDKLFLTYNFSRRPVKTK